MKSVGILGCGHFLPSKIVTNNDIVAMGVETSDEWIQERTGIVERRISAEDETVADLAEQSARNALENAGVSIGDIDLIIVATTSPDYPHFPSVACMLQDRLGAQAIAAFDVSAACSGFNYALTTAVQYVKTGQATKALVVASDTLSKFVDWTDRGICILFGDGSGAAVVGEVEPGFGVEYSRLYSLGSQAEILKVDAGGSKYPITRELIEEGRHYIHMNGRAVFKVAVSSVMEAIEEGLRESGLTGSDIDYLVLHQANLRIISHVAEHLGIADEKVLCNIQRYGNTSAASIPIVLSENVQAGTFKKGDRILTLGFGAGFTWGTNIIKWSK